MVPSKSRISLVVLLTHTSFHITRFCMFFLKVKLSSCTPFGLMCSFSAKLNSSSATLLRQPFYMLCTLAIVTSSKDANRCRLPCLHRNGHMQSCCQFTQISNLSFQIRKVIKYKLGWHSKVCRSCMLLFCYQLLMRSC